MRYLTNLDSIVVPANYVVGSYPQRRGRYNDRQIGCKDNCPTYSQLMNAAGKEAVFV